MRRTPGRSGGLTMLALGVTSTLALAACGSGDAGGGNALPSASQSLNAACPTPAVKPADKELTYWSMWTEDEPQGQVMKKAFDCFEKTAGVHVNVQWQGRKGYTQTLAPALNTDNVPDLFDQDVNKVSAAIAQPGGTQSVDDVFGMKIGEGDKTVKDVLTANTYDFPENADPQGHKFLVPYLLQSSAWWYNKDKIKDFAAPASTDAMFSMFDKAKPNAISQDGDIPFYNMYFFTQFAERYVGAGGLKKAASDKTGESWKSEPGFLKAAQLTARLSPYFIKGWNASKFPQVQQRWADGESSYLYVGTWAPSETREYLNKEGTGTKLNYGSFQIPKPADATHDTVEQMSIGFAVTKKAKHAEAAKAFIAYFLNKDLLQGIPNVSDNLAPRADLAVPDDLKDAKAAVDDTAKEHVLQYDSLDALAGGNWESEVFDQADSDLLNGKIQPQEFIDTLASKQAAFWKSRG